MQFRGRERHPLGAGAHRPNSRKPRQLLGQTGGRRAHRQREIDHVLGAEGGDQLAGRTQRDHLAMIEDRYAVAEALGFVHVVGGEENGVPRPAEALDHFPQLASRLGIEPRRRLIEEEQLGTAHQSAGDGQPLLLPSRQLPHPAPAFFAQGHQVEHFVHGVRVMIETAKELQGFFDRKLFRELRFLELNAQPFAEGPPSRAVIPAHAQDFDVAGVGEGEAFQDLDGGGLPGAIGPQETETLTGIDGEVQSRDGENVGVALDETAGADSRHVRRRRGLPAWPSRA